MKCKLIAILGFTFFIAAIIALCAYDIHLANQGFDKSEITSKELPIVFSQECLWLFVLIYTLNIGIDKNKFFCAETNYSTSHYLISLTYLAILHQAK